MRIGEVAQAAGTSTKTLRFYEDVGLLPPAERTRSGYRDYDAEVLGRLGFIHRGQAAGLTLAQIGQVLQIRDGGEAPCRHVTDLLKARIETIDRQIAELQQLRTAIAELRDHAAGADPTTCPPEDVCHYL
ncbi:heavy metal-responsive transcriptional regulator [Georgenia subflava]|uniref:MerR family DNA-binding protein n=1 Tax=Georgenia subflava TaxID=1622177 RepID=A0A6N7EKD9_9MICO|nr:heavy metal-responsive transcriptional regulator [Georgenia subflava]MPV37881.1 MerR family DNA-binding protein [Georgenia subflava]